MGKYIIRRLVLLIPTIIIVCIIVFALMRLVPGDAVDTIVNKMLQSGSTVDEDAVRAMLGLDKPAIQQFFIWISQLVRGDLGTSFFQYLPVGQLIGERLPATLELGILSLILSVCISIPTGLFCASHQDKIPDYVIRVIAALFCAIPVFWIATLVLIYPSIWWNYSPPMTFVSILKEPLTNLRMFLPPALISAIGSAGMQIRTVRTMTLEVLRQDYIRTAHAKGLGQRVVMFKHAFRNAMIPVVTMIGGNIAGLLGGNVVMENIFNIPGVGTLLVNGLNSRDYPIVQGCVLVLSLFVMVINLLVDITYKWIDPRVEIN